MDKIRLWALTIIALGFLANCAVRPQQPADMTPAPRLTPGTPAEADALWQQAEKARKAGNVNAAVASWEQIIHKYPNHAVAARSYHAIGTVYLDQKQTERALQFFDYLIYAYPSWDGLAQAKLDRLRALVLAGKKKVAVKEAMPLWDAANGQPDVQIGLSTLMAEVYGSDGDISTGFEWLTAGFGLARSPEGKKSLTQATVSLLDGADAGTVQRLLKRNPPDFMKVFLYYRLSQLDLPAGQAETARQGLTELLSRNPSHPLAAEMRTGTKGPPPPAAPPSVVAGPVNADRVGVLVPLNGPYAKYGDMVLKGLNLAAEEWNETHPARHLTLIIREAPTEAGLAAKSLEQLARDDGVLAVIGPLGVQSAKAMAPAANRYGIPLLALTQQDAETESGQFMVHVFIDNQALVRTLVRYCMDKSGFTRFAVLYPDDRYGQNLSRIFADTVKEAGGSLLASVSYKDKTTDFRAPLEKLLTIAKKNSPPSGVETTPFDALFIPDQVQTVALIAPQLPYNNVVGVTLLGTNLWGEAPLVQAGGVYVERAIFATPYMIDSQKPNAREFQEKFEAKYSTSPSYLEAQAYDALRLFLEAREGFGRDVQDRTVLLNNLFQIRGFEGVTGTYSFSPQGQVDRDYMLFQVVNGQLAPLTP